MRNCFHEKLFSNNCVDLSKNEQNAPKMHEYPCVIVEFVGIIELFLRSNTVSGRLGMLLSGLWLRIFLVQGRCGQKDPRKSPTKRCFAGAIMAHPRGKSHRLRMSFAT